jgi:predicted lipid-binding transport protein (Tim44 family)
MRKWLFALFALVFFAGLVPFDAEARRFGGGRSIGTQRQAIPDKPVTPPAATPVQQAAPAAGAAAAAAKPGMGRWLAPLAGLAAGLGLAYLLGDQLGSVVTALLFGVLAIAVVMMLMRLFRKPGQQTAPQGMQYAGIGNETVAAPPPSQATGGPAEPSFRAQFARRIPEGFNADAFVREAKKSFIALQGANDRGDASSIRDFVTDEMFQHLKADIDARAATGQQTDVVTLNAELLEVVTEGGTHWASVRFSGMLREDTGAAPQAFEEIWNLQKSAQGDSGWLLAGIQQVS